MKEVVGFLICAPQQLAYERPYIFQVKVIGNSPIAATTIPTIDKMIDTMISIHPVNFLILVKLKFIKILNDMDLFIDYS